MTATWPHSLGDSDPLFHIRPAEAIFGFLGLLLLFQAHAAHRHWCIVSERRRLLGEAGQGDDAALLADSTGGLLSDEPNNVQGRKQIEERLGKEIARARRSGRPLSLLILSLDETRLISQRYGSAVTERVRHEFGQQLKRATRGCDLAAQLAGDVFLAMLWDCPIGSVQRVLERVSPLVLNCDGKEIPVACSSAWVDYQAGDVPAELITRAQHMLQLYKKVDQDSAGSISAAR